MFSAVKLSSKMRILPSLDGFEMRVGSCFSLQLGMNVSIIYLYVSRYASSYSNMYITSAQ